MIYLRVLVLGICSWYKYKFRCQMWFILFEICFHNNLHPHRFVQKFKTQNIFLTFFGSISVGRNGSFTGVPVQLAKVTCEEVPCTHCRTWSLNDFVHLCFSVKKRIRIKNWNNINHVPPLNLNSNTKNATEVYEN